MKNKKWSMYVIILILLALFVGYQNRDQLFWGEQEIEIPLGLKQVGDWKLIEADNIKLYQKEEQTIQVEITKLSKRKIKERISEDATWNDETCCFEGSAVSWVTKDKEYIAFDTSVLPTNIQRKFQERFPPDCELGREIEDEREEEKLIDEPTKEPGAKFCGDNIIEAPEMCEPPGYTEDFNGVPHYVCKTEYADLLDLKCSEDTCQCHICYGEEEGEEECFDEPMIPLPKPGCGNSVQEPGETCEWTSPLGIVNSHPCPAGFGFECGKPGTKFECKCYRSKIPEEPPEEKPPQKPVETPTPEKEIDVSPPIVGLEGPEEDFEPYPWFRPEDFEPKKPEEKPKEEKPLPPELDPFGQPPLPPEEEPYQPKPPLQPGEEDPYPKLDPGLVPRLIEKPIDYTQLLEDKYGLFVEPGTMFNVEIDLSEECTADSENIVIPIPENYELVKTGPGIIVTIDLPKTETPEDPTTPPNPMIQGFGLREIDLDNKNIDFISSSDTGDNYFSVEERGENYFSADKKSNQITGAVVQEPGTRAKSIVLTSKVPEDKEVDPNTLTFLAKVDGVWEIIPTTRVGDNLIARIADANKYRNENGKLLVGLYASICDSCKETTFVKEYDGGTRNAVILVHGLFSSPKTYEDLIKYFEITKAPFQVWSYGYPSKLNYEGVVFALASYLEDNQHNFDTIRLVGHSMGGLVAQDVLWNGYNTGRQFVKKTKQAILVGTPNLGSTIKLESIKNILLNSKTAARVLGINPELVEVTQQGKTIPKVEGIEYDVIAGTSPYRLNIGARLLQQSVSSEPNDGLVTVVSAQTVGGDKIDDRCYNYFDPKLNHNELIDIEPAMKIIGRLLTKEYKEKEPNKVWMGYNKFIVIENNQVGQAYNLELKKIDEKEASAPLLCNCGNGVCGEGETSSNCPIDCLEAGLMNKFRYTQLITILLLIASLIVIITKGHNKFFYIVMAATLGSILLVSITSEKIPFILIGIWIGLLFLREIGKPRTKLPPKIEFEIKMAEANERVLDNKNTAAIYDKILKIYNKLEAINKPKAYDLLLRFATLDAFSKTEQIKNSLEKTFERISQEKLTIKQKKLILHRLGHMEQYSDKVKKILDKMSK